MPHRDESKSLLIPDGTTLTFEAPSEGGVSWRLRNTSEGLSVETKDERHGIRTEMYRPMLRLTPQGVFISGNLVVDGEVRQEFDKRKFAGRWEIVAGAIPGQSGDGNKKDVAVIVPSDDGDFILTYERADGTLASDTYQHVLRYNPRTRTLDSVPEKNKGRGERCISFWDGRSRGGTGKHRIFAMRKAIEGAPKGFEDVLLPWELATGDDGTWGGTEGG